MTRTTLTTLGLLAVTLCLSRPVHAGIRIVIPVDIIATTTPVYYEGHAAYWYGDRWYYRSGREWYEYRDEPRYLRDYREHHARERRFYGRTHDSWHREDRWEERRRDERREHEREEERRDRHHRD